VLVNYLDRERVIGFHYLGPNAGEVTQGFAAAFHAGTYVYLYVYIGVYMDA
jgi:thioredoxin reductase (NADPH)